MRYPARRAADIVLDAYMAKPKVLMISQNSSATGGSDMVFLQEIELLERAGHEVIPFCALGDAESELEQRFGKSFVHGAEFSNPSTKDLLAYIYNGAARRMIGEIIARDKPDICHLHIYYGKITASILGPLRRASIPCIQTLHEYRYTCPVSIPFIDGQTCTKCAPGYYLPSLLNRCNRGSLLRSGLSMAEMYVSDMLGSKRLDHYLCVSNRQRAFLLDKRLPANRSSVLYNSIDAVFSDDDSARDIDILYVGRIETYKGIDVLLDIARNLPQFKMVIVGEGNYLDEVRAKNVYLANVRWAGRLDKADVARMMRRARCLVVPSKWEETFGLISAEAMACGTPVVASRIGGIPEVVADGITGLVVDPTDLAGFTKAAARLLNDEATWRLFSKAGKARVEENFSRETHIARLTQTYDEVLVRRRAK